MWVLYCSSAILYSGYMHVFGGGKGVEWVGG